MKHLHVVYIYPCLLVCGIQTLFFLLFSLSDCMKCHVVKVQTYNWALLIHYESVVC